MNLTEQEIADLRAKAEAALKLSPGKDRWEFSSKGPSDALGLEGIFAVGKDGSKSIVVCNTGRESGDLIEEDGEFIAAANPITILGLLDEIKRLRADAEWRPISTAPKDGTEIDVLIDACERYTNVAYENGEWWIETYDKAFGDVRIAIRRQLTHWRPLPQPPEAS